MTAPPAIRPDITGLPPRFLNPRTPPGRGEIMPGWPTAIFYAFDHVVSVLTNEDLFTLDAPAGPGREDTVYDAIWAASGPEHDGRRGLVAEWFRPEAVDALKLKIEVFAAGLIAPVAAGPRTADIVSALARPLPALVACDIFGIHPGIAEQVSRWVDDQSAVLAAELMPAAEPLMDLLGELVDERYHHPGNDLISYAARSLHPDSPYRINGKKVTRKNVIAAVWSVLAAMLDTTKGAIASLFRQLAEHDPETGCLAELAADRDLIPGAVNEALRLDPVFWTVPAGVRDDCELGGLKLKAGERVLGILPSANRDPSVFEDPAAFNIRRSPNPQLAFGRGPHHCLGARLARLEMAVALDVALELLPRPWTCDGDAERRLGIVNQITMARLRFGEPPRAL